MRALLCRGEASRGLDESSAVAIVTRQIEGRVVFIAAWNKIFPFYPGSSGQSEAGRRDRSVVVTLT